MVRVKFLSMLGCSNVFSQLSGGVYLKCRLLLLILVFSLVLTGPRRQTQTLSSKYGGEVSWISAIYDEST